MPLNYRIATADDHPALVRLWSEEGGWDRLEAEAWADRLLRTPLGAATIAVAEDSRAGELVAQFAFIPSKIVVNGELVPAVRPFAPIIARSARLQALSLDPRKTPVASLFRTAVPELVERGVRVAYMIADPHWLLLLMFNPAMTHHKFPLWSLPLPIAGPIALGPGVEASPLGAWDGRVDGLWEAASRIHACQVIRNTQSLPWKVGRGDYHVLAVERRGELVGLVASRAKGDAQWLICDVVSADLGPSLRATLAAACNLAGGWNPPAGERPLRKVAILATPALEPVLGELGFSRDSYDFPLVVNRLGDSVPAPSVDPSRWYVSAND
jgi:hypothetical protein